MISLLVFKERLKEFYARFDIYINPVFRFTFSYITFYLLNQNLGFMAKLKNPLIPLVLSLVCSFLPYGAITFLAAGFMIVHMYGVSFEITLIMLVFLLVISLLYYGFQPGDSYLLVLTPMMFFLKIPYAVPLLVGLSGGIVSVIPVSCGVFIYYVLIYVKQNAGALTNDASVDLTQKYGQIIKGIMANQLMLVMITAFALGIIVVYLIRKLAVDYAWVIAIMAGTIAQLGVIFMGDITMNISVSLGQLLFGVLGSALIAGVYHFFVFAVDYSRTEYTQFEDDDYFYYVKAVPKITVSTPDVKVQKINSRKAKRGSR